MKVYIKPEIDINNFFVEDILTQSGTSPISGSAATVLKESGVDITNDNYGASLNVADLIGEY